MLLIVSARTSFEEIFGSEVVIVPKNCTSFISCRGMEKFKSSTENELLLLLFKLSVF
jgi:hypothetical protein